jgi:CheY-like chemotaxis protein
MVSWNWGVKSHENFFYNLLPRCQNVGHMTRPLILVSYEKMLPGSQLLNRLQDLGYEVQAINDSALLPDKAQEAKPLLIIADLEPRHVQVCEAIGRLRIAPDTIHIPLIALASAQNTKAQEGARLAGATLVVSDQAILLHLKQFLEQALQVD